MSASVDPIKLFSYFVHSTLIRISLLTYYFFPGCQAKLTSRNFCFVSRSFTTSPDLFTYLLLFRRMSGSVDLKNTFFVSCSFTFLPDFLTYCFSKDVRLSRPKKNCSCISFIQRFSGFPYLLTTFSKDVRLSWLQEFFFSYLAYLPLNRISFLTYHFFQGCQAEWTSNKLFFVSRLVDFRSGFWHWEWLTEGVTHSSISPKLFFLLSRLIDLWIEFWPQKGHPKWSPGRVLAKNNFSVSSYLA